MLLSSGFEGMTFRLRCDGKSLLVADVDNDDWGFFYSHAKYKGERKITRGFVSIRDMADHWICSSLGAALSPNIATTPYDNNEPKKIPEVKA